MISIDWNKVLHQLEYDKNNPLLFNNGFFVYFLVVFMVFYYLFRKNYKHRAVVLSLFSLYFFYKASGTFVWIVIVSAFFNYGISNLIYKAKTKGWKAFHLFWSIIFNLVLLFYFKYTDFFIQVLNNVSQFKIDPLHILLPIGISFFTFENLSYTIDIYRGEIKPEKGIVNYVLFLSFFPKLVMGPIVRAKDFIPQLKQDYFVSSHDFSKGFYLIITGLIKKLIISDYISVNLVNYVFDGPHLHNGLECLVALYGYAIVIYCDFSGYSDVAIGISKWMGITIPPNFMSPYQSKSVSEFWRRWHISLSSWLRDYLYIAMGGNRKGTFRTNVNLFLTMLIGGFWHGASWNFIIWGALHGIGLGVNKFWNALFGKMKVFPKWISNTFYGLITFHFVCFCWIFFKASSFETALQFLHQIGYQFTFDGGVEFVENYKIVLVMIAIGYAIHLIPDSVPEKIIEKQKNFPLIYFVVLLLSFIALYSFFKSAEPVMPIYLQF
ncbi:MBOAT family O-acyltransferase [Flavobacterium aciduliphilum]|uniref:D-alanyl-lipoteichoic acid acyltransferase DltB (MBOAT superfamily) n=1 Tax=Flavobacterium aciduliphilum TaxID=1101402 RepID=A0A328YG63_9FLAO|nr:MBOAT family O-acyltransferase [Flavobacterium aciduliphilum]RAR71695.1 D-alanyl-lipoteichoic acid acyltransferase DltB (MBOAT superfamily) [Flavobacterium aciduliphilum]